VADRLAGKVVIISGGARGQGASHAALLAREGAQVIIGDVLDEEGGRHAAELRSEGLEVSHTRLDVTRAADWEACVALAERQHGSLDVLVNNAGIVRLEGITDETEEGWSKVIAVNQTGVFLGMKHAIPAMRRNGGGSIINISSVWGLVGARDHIAYIASKGAVAVMTKCAAVSYAEDNIRANSICPGLVMTPMAELETDESNEEAIAASVMKRPAEPREISAGVLFLASDESSYVTGTELVIDGGVLAQ
jgi:NAD(P)-dependent dehydrogenase (short-subunit alcohol dehydrogenase family)